MCSVTAPLKTCENVQKRTWCVLGTTENKTRAGNVRWTENETFEKERTALDYIDADNQCHSFGKRILNPHSRMMSVTDLRDERSYNLGTRSRL